MVYWLMYLSIARPEIYNENASKAGGWEGTRDFRIVAKTPRSALITSFELEPVDGGAVAEYRPGQYLGVWRSRKVSRIRKFVPVLFDSQTGWQRLSYCGGNAKRVGRYPTGCTITPMLAMSLKLVAPAGDFFMAVADDTPVTLIFCRCWSNANAGNARHAGKSRPHSTSELVPCGRKWDGSRLC
ncbi:Nitric oxide dioxygenase [Streptococcus pneumoniae]|nr:Nitric oxide dioxygenase [Streptococcus pneumoniae]